VREVTNQFLSNARLYSSVLSDRLKCSSVLEEVPLLPVRPSVNDAYDGVGVNSTVDVTSLQ